MDVTQVFFENYTATEPVVINQGGTSSSKTISILQNLAIKALKSNECVITVVAQDIPNIKRGALRDFEKYVLCEEKIKDKIASYNKTGRTFLFKNDSIIEFQSYENEQDARSGKRDYLFINEANGITYDIFNQLNSRTKIQTFIDFNPSSEFWVHEKIIKNDIPHKLIISDYRHNPFTPQKIINDLDLLKKRDYALWKVYARGLTGKIEGLIYSNYKLINKEEIPKDLEYAFGIDFGFNHPTALIKVYFQEENIYIEELLYQTNLITTELISLLKDFKINKNDVIYADSARPDTIEEIYKAGFNVKKADKSVIDGINKIKSKNIFVTKNSINTIKEFSSYKWELDKNGKTLESPVKFKDDAMDAIRYCVYNYLKREVYSWKF